MMKPTGRQPKMPSDRLNVTNNGAHTALNVLVTLLIIILGLCLSGCSHDDDPASPEETISVPFTPYGPSSTTLGIVEHYSTGGAESSSGHSLEYRFDWGDGDRSPWSCNATVPHGWSLEGGYAVTAQARCATHTDRSSSWSDEMMVTVGEAISTPDIPTGALRTDLGNVETYTTGGAESSSGHDLEYRFDWGDGSQSSWASSGSAPHGWSIEDDYRVKAQARCATHTDKLSSWSSEETVVVGETISTASSPSGQPSVRPGSTKMYCSDGALSSRDHQILYQFDWEGRTTPLWTTSNCVSIYWSSTGDFYVKARARCAIHPDAVSPWSNPLLVVVTAHEVITTPHTPTGPMDTDVGKTETYSTGGAISNYDHDLEYRFDWGDGNESPWSSSTSASRSWSAEGSYVVKAQARCKIHISRVSSWSTGLTVTVTSP
ncbi:MAG: hypothetical protein JSW58_03935 [Candidatus Latescibacterota bacterium]|nr:MAG: hypothetical protein JSW58_03935 [Candidatus Latescibacterota bacterium]